MSGLAEEGAQEAASPKEEPGGEQAGAGTASSGENVGVEDLLDQVRALRIGDFLLSTASTLASLAYGKLEAGDLEQARLGIDALRALVPALEGHVPESASRDLAQAVTNLQLAYAGAVPGTPS